MCRCPAVARTSLLRSLTAHRFATQRRPTQALAAGKDGVLVVRWRGVARGGAERGGGGGQVGWWRFAFVRLRQFERGQRLLELRDPIDRLCSSPPALPCVPSTAAGLTPLTKGSRQLARVWGILVPPLTLVLRPRIISPLDSTNQHSSKRAPGQQHHPLARPRPYQKQQQQQQPQVRAPSASSFTSPHPPAPRPPHLHDPSITTHTAPAIMGGGTATASRQSAQQQNDDMGA